MRELCILSRNNNYAMAIYIVYLKININTLVTIQRF